VKYSVKQGLQIRSTKHPLLIVATVISAVVVAVAATAQAASVTQKTVRPNDIRPIAEAVSGDPGWYRTVTGTGAAEATSTMPYNNAGSAEFGVGDSASYAELGLYNELSAYKLTELSGLSYATRQTVDNLKAVSLQLGLDLDTTDTDLSWQGRMVYEPYLNQPYYPAGTGVVDGVWQTWLTLSPGANWWFTWSASATTAHGANPCPQSDPCTTAEILSLFPNAGFNAGFGNPLILKAGSGWSSFAGFADVPTITTAAGDTVYYDFEPVQTTPTEPTTKEECFKGGWQNFGFNNQGACVAFVSKGKPNTQ
jgi:hypothetical protein